MSVTLDGISITTQPKSEIITQIKAMMSASKFHTLITLNPEILIAAKSNSNLKQAIMSADIVIPESNGITWAIQTIHDQKSPPIPGVELTHDLLSLGQHRVYIVGGLPDQTHATLGALKSRYPNTLFCGAHHGYFTQEEEPELIQDIRHQSPDIILSAMGVLKQDDFLLRLKSHLNHGWGIGVGGAIDVLSGRKRRAPQWIQAFKCEWVYRGICEPKRIIKWKVLIQFVLQTYRFRKSGK